MVKSMTRQEFNKKFNQALFIIGELFVQELQRVAPVRDGFLRQNITSEVKGNIINITMPEYGLFLEFGSAPHIIRAKNAKALHWKDKTGSDHFAKVVHHPGTTPQPFIRSTINTKLRDIIDTGLRAVLT